MQEKLEKKSVSCSHQCNQFHTTKNQIYEMYKPKKTTNFATQIFLITLGQLMPEPQMS